MTFRIVPFLPYDGAAEDAALRRIDIAAIDRAVAGG